jgi:hypothetical protein
MGAATRIRCGWIRSLSWRGGLFAGFALEAYSAAKHVQQLHCHSPTASMAVPCTPLPETGAMTSLYETDFFAWANEQASLLRAGKLSSADIENIAEEIESMGKSEKRELVSRLTILLLHLLKWQFQPGLRGNSWRYTIKVQRRDLARHLADNPSLSAQLPELLGDSYTSAVLLAAGETGLPESLFPTICLWSYQQVVDPDFWPDAPN